MKCRIFWVLTSVHAQNPSILSASSLNSASISIPEFLHLSELLPEIHHVGSDAPSFRNPLQHPDRWGQMPPTPPTVSWHVPPCALLAFRTISSVEWASLWTFRAPCGVTIEGSWGIVEDKTENIFCYPEVHVPVKKTINKIDKLYHIFDSNNY